MEVNSVDWQLLKHYTLSPASQSFEIAEKTNGKNIRGWHNPSKEYRKIPVFRITCFSDRITGISGKTGGNELVIQDYKNSTLSIRLNRQNATAETDCLSWNYE